MTDMAIRLMLKQNRVLCLLYDSLSELLQHNAYLLMSWKEKEYKSFDSHRLHYHLRLFLDLLMKKYGEGDMLYLKYHNSLIL